jgi:hypothetical protein
MSSATTVAPIENPIVTEGEMVDETDTPVALVEDEDPIVTAFLPPEEGFNTNLY